MMANKDKIADLFNSPDRIKFRDFLKSDLEEFDELEFKKDYISYDKLAKHILAMANTNNGIIIFGIEEDKQHKLTPVGIELRDKTDIKNKLSQIIPDLLEYEILDFKYENEVEWNKIKNMKFQMIIVKYTPESIPFMSKIEKGVVKPHEIYCRRSNSSDKVRQEDIDKILNNRINSSLNNQNIKSLSDELQQLEILTAELSGVKSLLHTFNPTYRELVKNFARKKIILIEKELGVENIKLNIDNEKL